MERQNSRVNNVNDDETDSRAIFGALVELERMIEQEKNDKLNLEKKFDELYDQNESPATFSGLVQEANKLIRPKPPLFPASSKIQEAADEIIELIQKRQELGGSENMYNKLTKTSHQVNEFKKQITTQLSVNKKSNELIRKGSKSTARQQSTEVLQEVLKRMEANQKNKENEPAIDPEKINSMIKLDDSSNSQPETPPKLSKKDQFFERIDQWEQKKAANLTRKIREKERDESSKTSGWFKPSINPKTNKIVQKKRGTSSSQPFHKRLNKVLEEREEFKKGVRHKYEAIEKDYMEKNCYFHPKVADTSSYVAPENRLAAKKSELHLQKPQRAGDKFLDKLEEYEQRRRIHLNLLQRKKYEEEVNSLKEKPSISPFSQKLAQEKTQLLGVSDKLYLDAAVKEEKLEKMRRERMKEVCPFKPQIKKLPPKPQSQAGSQSQLIKALSNIEQLLKEGASTHRTLPRSSQQGLLMEDSESNTNLRSILKSPSKFTPDRSREEDSEQPQTKKSVRIKEARVASKPPANSARSRSKNTSFIDESGFVNILFDRNSILELTKLLK